jgi:hypothetical protein
LNSGSFERLVRALCFNQFGPSGTVFASGPDGARDFVVDGKIVGYESKNWIGYLVVQAKFKETLRGGNDDVAWLIKQLNEELKKFAAPTSNLLRPRYYIIATNIRLSGADGTKKKGQKTSGGYAKVYRALNEWMDKVGILDFDIWPADKLEDLLAAAPAIRQTYAMWTTPGDVLTEIIRNLHTEKPDFVSAIRRSLKASLRKDQFVRLKDAGSVTDLQIRTSQVFVDLPIERYGKILDEKFQNAAKADTTDSQNMAVASLIYKARDVLSGRVYRGSVHDDLPLRVMNNRIVLLGGPGQGKSTVVVFLAQLLRAAILADDRTLAEDPTVCRLVPEVLGVATREGIAIPLPRRYPVHVSLPRFADAVSNSKLRSEALPSLLQYIADELSVLSDQKISKADLRIWLTEYPWLVICDGLDEVPPSGERTAVLEQISTLVSEVSDLRADVLFVVTTRPQGYNSDLGQDMWEHWKLKDLNTGQALRYAEGFALAQYPDDEERRGDIYSGLSDAAKNPATSRLMITPLQVTILHMIVDTGGSVPTARWTLFNDYFEVLRKREKAKGGDTQKAIERNWSHLSPIHQRAGLLLQIESERPGKANAAMGSLRFRELISEYLSSLGYKSDSLAERVDELMEVALNRLVLLSSREEGKISFDVRSLQEYMAAAALTGAAPYELEERLSHIAARSHWTHVFLIAVSRCFADDGLEHMRATAVQIPRTLETMEIDRFARSGARLALEMFIDGVAVDHPKFRRMLAVHALELLELGPDYYESRLANVWEPETAEIVGQILHSRLVGDNAMCKRAAWRMYSGENGLSNRQALAMAEGCWPVDLEDAIRVVNGATLPFGSGELTNRAITTLENISPAKLRLSYYVANRQAKAATAADRKLASYYFTSHLSDLEEVRLFGAETGVSVGIISLQTTIFDEIPWTAEMQKGRWAIIWKTVEFCRSGDSRELASFFEWVLEQKLILELRSLLNHMPWPIAGIISAVEDEKTLAELVDRVSVGGFGSRPDWLKAERRWVQSGVNKNDLLVGRTGFWFDENVANVGAPRLQITTMVLEEATLRTRGQVEDLLDVVDQISNKHLLAAYFNLLWMWAADTGFKHASAIEARRAVSLAERADIQEVDVSFLSSFDAPVWSDADLVERLDRLASRGVSDAWYSSGNVGFDELVKACNEYEHLRDLLWLLLLYYPSEAVRERPLARTVSYLKPSAFERRGSDSAVARFAVEVLRIFRDRDYGKERTQFCQSVMGARAVSSEVFSVVSKLIEDADLSQEARELLARDAIVTEIGEPSCGTSSLIGVLRRILDGRLTDLIDEKRWSALRLPGDLFRVLQGKND